MGLFRSADAGSGADTAVYAAGPAAPLEKTATAANVAGALGDEPIPLRIVETVVVGQLTGRDSANDTAARWNVYGADLGHMFRHRGKIYMVFGDTVGPTGFDASDWRSNTMARIADPDPRHGLPFETMITGPDGAAKELIPSRKVDGEEKTVIPTYGISIGARMYLHYMSVRRWLDPGAWAVGHSGIAYSDDDGQSWATPSEAIWPRNSGFEQVAFVLYKDVLYTFGIPEGRFGGARLRRVAPERILAPDAYEYWDGKRWVADAAAAATLIPEPVGELSVAWSETHRRWLMMYLEVKRHAVVLRTAPRLTGPWSEAQVVITADAYPGLYGPYIVPGSQIGTHLHYTMSRWDPYNVFLMRTTLERIPTATLSVRSISAVRRAGETPVAGQN